MARRRHAGYPIVNTSDGLTWHWHRQSALSRACKLGTCAGPSPAQVLELADARGPLVGHLEPGAVGTLERAPTKPKQTARRMVM